MSAPARSVRARSGRIPSAFADSAAAPARKSLDDAFELIEAVLVSDDSCDGTGATARSRARSPVGGGSSSAIPRRTASAGGFDLSGCRRVAVQKRGGQAQRADVDRPHPGRSEELRPDDDLCRAAADVADRDHALTGVRRGRRRRRTRGGPPPRRRRTRTSAPVARPIASSRRSRRVALAPGRGDDGLELAHAELASDPRVVAGHLPDLVELLAPHAPVQQDLLAETQMLPLLAEAANLVAGH